MCSFCRSEIYEKEDQSKYNTIEAGDSGIKENTTVTKLKAVSACADDILKTNVFHPVGHWGIISLLVTCLYSVLATLPVRVLFSLAVLFMVEILPKFYSLSRTVVIFQH